MELNTRGVLINGMEMPKHCWQCRLKDGDNICILLDEDCTKIWSEQNGIWYLPIPYRLPNCPLTELPDHITWVNRDAIVDKLGINDDCDNCKYVCGGFCAKGGAFVDACEAIFDAPTIGPAKHGKWIDHVTDSWCSECGGRIQKEQTKMFSICPYCGAKMEMGNESTN